MATSNGALRQFTATQNIETNSQFAERLEEYTGGGLRFDYTVNDRLSVSLDLSTSETQRRENIIQTRLQSEDVDIYGNDVLGADGNGEVRTAAQIFANGSLVPTWTLQDFDVNYHGAFADEARTRLDLNQFRNNKISAVRADFDYIPDSEFIIGVKGGVRLSKLEYDSVPGGSGTNNRTEVTFSDEAAAMANDACRNNAFPESGFFDDETGGAPLFTNVDSEGNVISAGTGNSFATFDPICLAETLLGTVTNDAGEVLTIANAFPTVDDSDRQDIAAVDVEEKTIAAYLQADYDTFINDYGVRGNFGLRIVRTEVSSLSYRGPLQATRDENGLITGIAPITDASSLNVTSNGALRQFTATQNIETNSQFAERLEEYTGGGLRFDYTVNDRLSVSLDLSTSETQRRENIIQTRLQSEDVDIYGNDVLGADGNGEVRTAAQIFANGSLVPTWTLQDFDVNYHGAFADEARTRLDLNQFRNNKISAVRADFDYIPDSEFIIGVKGGVRLSKLEYDSVPGGSGTNNRTEVTFSDEAAAMANDACRNNAFPESGFFDDETGGAPLFTNVDSEGNVISAGTGNSFATFDPICLAETLLGTVTNDAGEVLTIANAFPTVDDSDRQDIAAVDVEEKTIAAYLQADYDTFINDYGVRGNFGLRIVRTEVSSLSYRGPLQATRDENGLITGIAPITDELIQVEGGGDYTELLPSFNLIVDLSDEVMFRGAIYRGLSRPDPSDLGFGRNFLGLDEDSDTGEISDALARAVAVGNPVLEPFLSWNVDTAIEWYPNEDTILALGLYYKSFEGGFSNTSQTEIFEVDGEELETIVTAPQTSDDTSTIYGAEITATHSFSYLDSWLSGFGIKLSYNYADSNFEFQDESFGESTVIDPSSGDLISRTGIVAPANLFGFSEHVISTQLYYQWEDLSASINYKYRSNYFQQFVNTPGAIRFIDDTEVFEARVSYRLNKNWKFSLEAINIFDEPRRQYRPTQDNFAEINVYGQRVFAGVQFRY